MPDLTLRNIRSPLLLQLCLILPLLSRQVQSLRSLRLLVARLSEYETHVNIPIQPTKAVHVRII
jgi:hypothetical protein